MLSRRLGLRKSIYSFILRAVFYVLPAKYFKMFIYLSVIGMINRLRFIKVNIDKVNQTKFVAMLSVSFNKDVMLLPGYTLDLFWDDNLLNQLILINGRMYRISEALTKIEIAGEALDAIVNRIYNYLPILDRFKLTGLNYNEKESFLTDLKEVITTEY